MPPTPALDGSQHLSLTESHLSAEATSWPEQPAAGHPPSPRGSGDRAAHGSESSQSHGGETLIEEGGDLDIVERVDGDLEKGEKGAAEGKGAEAIAGTEAPPLAADGTPVLVVDWKENDPAFPKNWSNRSRMGATFIVAAFTFLSPLSSTMISPATAQLAAKFDITDAVLESMVTSIFVLAYAIGPLFFGPASELWGRTVVLQLANLIYLVFNFVCAFAPNTGSMLAFRFLAGLGGSAPLAIGAGVLGDLWRPEERGKAASYYSLGPLIGPAVGPIAGGWIAQRVPNDGYRWVFFSTTIFCALVQLFGLRFLKETYSPVLLHRQALALKKEMGLPKDSDKVQTVFEIRERKTLRHIITHGLIRPFSMFAAEHIIKVLAVYMGIIYGIIYLTITSTTTIFTEIYGENVGLAGTNFIAQGLGFLIMAQIQGRLMDVLYRKLKNHYASDGKPEFRLPLMVPASIFLPLGLLLYGWGAEHHLHWIVVDIGMFFIAAGMIGNFQVINLYLIDTFSIYAASALAAATFLRSLCGFAFPLFATYMWEGIGYGWGCTLLALVAMAVSWPAIPILYLYGEKIRKTSKYAVKKR
ncbi:major facilitator superfamily domain-containing protein [Leucosporidium creatinivorum]|uniref:Major facilitator superfamily domain-containing protein n=1 Tax=Leucosporidium creatinivorum TaxID=106004 RepID=A0A1Y2G272_9BASI|nr:major facilitator superfamily domain-containing protein [Leucosporidium creatinivorum]